MLNLLKSIASEQAKIDKQLEEKDSTAEFYREFRSKYCCATADDVCAIDQVDFATALICCDAPQLDAAMVKSALQKANGFLNVCDDSNVAVATFDVLDALLAMREYQTAIDVFNATKKLKFLDYFKDSSILIVALAEVVKKYKIKPAEFTAFMELYKSCPEKVFTAFSLIGAFKKFKREKDIHQENIERVSEIFGLKVRDKTKNKYIQSELATKWRVPSMMQSAKVAFNYGGQIESRDTSRRRALIKQKKAYEELEAKLPALLENGEIRNAVELINKIPSSTVRLELLKLIYTHNHEIHQGLSKEYANLSSNDASKYRILLSNFGISPDSYDVRNIMINSLSDVEEILKALHGWNITNPTTLITILTTTSKDTVEALGSLVKARILTEKFLRKEPALFDRSSIEYQNLYQNMELLKEKNINPKLFKASEEALLLPQATLRKSLDTLNSYSLLSSMNANTSYHFFGNTSLHIGIDTLLELGYEKYLEEDLSLLNYQSAFKRLRLLKELNIPISSKEELLQVLTTDKFYMADSAIPNYIYNATPYNLPQVARVRQAKTVLPPAELEAFSLTPRTYEIGGVLISKNKVKRNLRFLSPRASAKNRLLYGVLQGSILNDEEVANIKKALGMHKKTAKTMQKLPE